MRLELSRRAQADLDDVRDDSVARFGAIRAIDYIDTIEEVFRRLVAYPLSGVKRDGLGEIRSISAGEHRVFYKVTADTVVIARLLLKAMDVEYL